MKNIIAVILITSLFSALAADSTLAKIKVEHQKRMIILEKKYHDLQIGKYKTYITKLKEHQKQVMASGDLTSANKIQLEITKATKALQSLTKVSKPIGKSSKAKPSSVVKKVVKLTSKIKASTFIKNFPDYTYDVDKWSGFRKFLFCPDGTVLIRSNIGNSKSTWRLSNDEKILLLGTGDKLIRNGESFSYIMKSGQKWGIRLFASPLEAFYGTWAYRANNKDYQRSFHRDGTFEIKSGSTVYMKKKFGVTFIKDRYYFGAGGQAHSIEKGLLSGVKATKE